MGGLPRRATFIRQERDQGNGILILDSGNFVSDKPLSEPSLEPAGLKAELILRAMERMGYHAVALGEMDLYLGLKRLTDLSGMTDVSFLSANLVDSSGKPVFESHIVLKAGGNNVGVIGLTATPADRRMLTQRMPGTAVKDPIRTAKEEIEDIREECDLIVVLSNIGYSRDLELVRSVPGIDILISGGTKRFMRRPVNESRTLLTSGFYEGRAIGKLVIEQAGRIKGWIPRQELDFMDQQIKAAEEKAGTTAGKSHLDELRKKREEARHLTPYKPDLINLDPSFANDPQVASMIADYRKKLAESSVNNTGPPAGIEEQERYTGAEVCAGCHDSRYRFWLTTDHSRAFDSLAPKNAGADPDCVPCHVTGYMRRTGYWPKAPREDLRGVQCEACHGVGSLHARSPDLYSLLHLPAAPQCMDCHTEEQDDDFDYLRDRKTVCAEAE